MVFEQAELRGASITTKASIARRRSAITLGLDAPLTIEAAAALGCKEKLFTTEGEIRPDLFSTACFRLPVEHLAVALELDGIAKREVRAPEAQAGNDRARPGRDPAETGAGHSRVLPHAARCAGFRDGGGHCPASLPHLGEDLAERFRRVENPRRHEYGSTSSQEPRNRTRKARR